MRDWLREGLGRRPTWMNALLGFCAYMTFVYVPWDFLAKPVAEDAEIWFGVPLHGWAAKATEPLHLALYAAGTWGFWHMRRWMWPWASVYAAQVAIGMVVWSLWAFDGARAAGTAVATGAPIAAIAVALWRARDRFHSAA
jgi:hypothetical protein